MKKRLWMTIAIVCVFVCSVAAFAMASSNVPSAKVEFQGSELDADGYFTMEMRVYNARFNAFQVVLWYDEETVVPVDANGEATNRFSEFAQAEDSGWMSTIGTSIDTERGLIDFTGYVTPGQSVAVDQEGETGVAVVGESGLSLFTFRFKKVGSDPAVLKLATQDGGTPWQPYLPEGCAVVDAGVSAQATVEISFQEDTGENTTVDVPVPGGPELSADALLEQVMILKIGDHAALVDGGVTAIYPGERTVTAYIRGDRTYVPVRFVAEHLGAEVSWDNGTVVIEKDGHVIRMPVGSLTYTVNGESRTMDAPAELVDSAEGYVRTMVPIRFVTEALEYQIEWDSSRRLVVVADPDLGWDPEGNAEGQAMDEAVARLALYGGFV